MDKKEAGVKIGFITNAFTWSGEKDLCTISSWAGKHGFDDLEIGPDIPLDESLFAEARKNSGIVPSAFIYCRNFLSSDRAKAEEYEKGLSARIAFAPKVGIDKIICSTGVDTALSQVEGNMLKYDPEASLDRVIKRLEPAVALAEKNKVRLCFETCPFMGNISISPYMWSRIFSLIDSPFLGIAYDPSHFVWEMMDLYSPILEWKDKIFHVHGKDCEVLPDVLKKIGILHNFTLEGTASGVGENAVAKTWWRYRLVGSGNIDWKRLIGNLHTIDYAGTFSIEHEDPIWEGSLEKVKTGLEMALTHIKEVL